MARPVSDVAWQVLDGRVVVVDLAGKVVLGLNEAASVIWTACAAGDESPVAALCRRFDVAEDQARDDVLAFVSSMRERGLMAD
jgi:hypothetical protein